MSVVESAASGRLQLLSRFESLRTSLLQAHFADRMQKPLAYWVLPSDRRLPLALLRRTLDDLLHTPFDQLSATRGIGDKKISSLVELLRRATLEMPSTSVPCSSEDVLFSSRQAPPASPNGHEFDPASVSESLWTQWRATVRRRQLENEKLGRLAPSLARLPSVIWHAPMRKYLDDDLMEIRQWRTHGEKRVRAVLEVFHAVHTALSLAQPSPHLALRLQPGFIAPVESWIAATLADDAMPALGDIRAQLMTPLLRQLAIDVGEATSQVAAGRWGVSGAPLTVRMQARRLGVTRARVYQLLDDCGQVFEVRWPEGKMQLDALAAKLTGDDRLGERLAAVSAVRDVCFPRKEAAIGPHDCRVDMPGIARARPQAISQTTW